MGLFDDYDPATYQGAQGGLLDQLLASVAATPTPSAGFPSSPMDAQASAPAAAPQPQNAPVAVGDYQMPRIGSGFAPPAINSDTGETVAPAPAAAPAQQPTQPAALTPAPTPSFLDTIRSHLNASDQSMSHGGGLIGGLTSLVTGQRRDPQAQLLADQAQQRQVQAQQMAAVLTANGVPQQRAVQLATIHAIDPEAGRKLIESEIGPQTVQSLGNGYVWDARQNKAIKAYEPDDKNKLLKIGQDGLGREQYGVFNPSDGSIKPYNAPGATDSGGGLGDMNRTGDAYLASMPKSEANIVKMMAEGTQAPPSAFALGKTAWVNRIAAAKNYDPTFDGANWAGRVAGVKDFSAGKSSEMVRSANQTLAHVNSLLDSADALHNGNYPALNWVGNQASAAMGSGAPGAFTTNAHAVAEEMSKVFKGSNMSDSEIRSWEQNLSPNMSPEQQRAQIGKLSELLHGSLDALEEKRLNSIGPMAAQKQGPLIKPTGQAVLQRIDGWLKAGNGRARSGGRRHRANWRQMERGAVMVTLNINGYRVKVSDSFKSKSLAEQQKLVAWIVSSISPDDHPSAKNVVRSGTKWSVVQ